MKYNKIFCVLALAAIFTLLVLTIPATPAQAQTIICNPSSGAAGTTGVTVTGSVAGYTGATVPVYIFFGATPAGTGTITAVTGAITGSLQFLLQPLPGQLLLLSIPQLHIPPP